MLMSRFTPGFSWHGGGALPARHLLLSVGEARARLRAAAAEGLRHSCLQVPHGAMLPRDRQVSNRRKYHSKRMSLAISVFGCTSLCSRDILFHSHVHACKQVERGRGCSCWKYSDEAAQFGRAVCRVRRLGIVCSATARPRLQV